LVGESSGLISRAGYVAGDEIHDGLGIFKTVGVVVAVFLENLLYDTALSDKGFVHFLEVVLIRDSLVGKATNGYDWDLVLCKNLNFAQSIALESVSRERVANAPFCEESLPEVFLRFPWPTGDVAYGGVHIQAGDFVWIGCGPIECEISSAAESFDYYFVG